MTGTSQQDNSQGKDTKSEAPHWIAIIAVIISLLSFGFTYYRTTSFGDVTPLAPSAYAIVRGVDPNLEGEPKPGKGVGVGPWPSDHVVLPMEWGNSSGSSVLVTDPVLVFNKIDRNNEPTDDEIRFFLVGELKEISPGVLTNVNTKPYTFKSTLVLEPHSVSQNVLVFRVEDWDDKNRCFRFHQGQSYGVDMEFRRVPENPLLGHLWTVLRRQGIRSEHLIDQLKILETANWISPYGKGESIGWDYFSLLPGARATSNEPVPEDTEKHYSELSECL